jgi:hypothetical protein
MRFYFREQIIRKTNKVLRTAHIAKEMNNPRGGCICKCLLNPEKWLLLDQLPERTHLCRRCETIAWPDLAGAGSAEENIT